MNKSRLEAFSDGVFAIAITILVLNITIEDVAYADLSGALIGLLPKIFSYVMSFILIGLYWLGHHFYFERIRQVDGNFVLMNILLLMLISFMPFPTFLLGKYPLGQLPLTLYGCTLIATNAVSFLMLVYIYKNQHLANEHFQNEFYKLQLPLFFSINLMYAAGIVCSFYWPHISYAIYIFVLFFALVSFVGRMNATAKAR